MNVPRIRRGNTAAEAAMAAMKGTISNEPVLDMHELRTNSTHGAKAVHPIDWPNFMVSKNANKCSPNAGDKKSS
jgi:hypothetical protein